MRVLKRDVPCIVVVEFDGGDLPALCIGVSGGTDGRNAIILSSEGHIVDVETKRIIRKGERIDVRSLAEDLYRHG